MRKAISLIPGLSGGSQGRTSSTSLSPQDVVAVLGKASSGEETYQEGSVSPFMTQAWNIRLKDPLLL